MIFHFFVFCLQFFPTNCFRFFVEVEVEDLLAVWAYRVCLAMVCGPLDFLPYEKGGLFCEFLFLWLNLKICYDPIVICGYAQPVSLFLWNKCTNQSKIDMWWGKKFSESVHFCNISWSDWARLRFPIEWMPSLLSTCYRNLYEICDAFLLVCQFELVMSEWKQSEYQIEERDF